MNASLGPPWRLVTGENENARLGSYCGRRAETQATQPVPPRAKSRDRASALPGRLPRSCGRTSCISGRLASPQAGLALPVEVVKLREKRPQYTKTPQMWGTSTRGRYGSTPAMGATAYKNPAPGVFSSAQVPGSSCQAKRQVVGGLRSLGHTGRIWVKKAKCTRAEQHNMNGTSYL